MIDLSSNAPALEGHHVAKQQMGTGSAATTQAFLSRSDTRWVTFLAIEPKDATEGQIFLLAA